MARGEPGGNLLRDYGAAIAIAVVIALLIRTFLLEAYRIPTSTMKPSLEPGDTIFASKWTYGMRLPGQDAPFTRGRKPVYGEVVVFSSPTDPERDSIKRVVGLEGDTVEVKDGRLRLNGKGVTLPPTRKNAVCGEEQLPGSRYAVCWEPPLLEDIGPQKVPPGSLFVLGDLRSQPKDVNAPRNWGIVPLASLKAKALWVWLSIEPLGNTSSQGWFSRIRFERMFKRIPE